VSAPAGHLAALAATAVLGVGTKLYAGPGAGWVGGYAGGIPYEVFWILLAGIAWPRARPALLAGCVLAATSLLETLQLWQPEPLQAVRRTFLGHALLGSQFSVWDFPHYALGCAAGAALLSRLRRPPRRAFPRRG